VPFFDLNLEPDGRSHRACGAYFWEQPGAQPVPLLRRNTSGDADDRVRDGDAIRVGTLRGCGCLGRRWLGSRRGYGGDFRGFEFLSQRLGEQIDYRRRVLAPRRVGVANYLSFDLDDGGTTMAEQQKAGSSNEAQIEFCVGLQWLDLLASGTARRPQHRPQHCRHGVRGVPLDVSRQRAGRDAPGRRGRASAPVASPFHRFAVPRPYSENASLESAFSAAS